MKVVVLSWYPPSAIQQFYSRAIRITQEEYYLCATITQTLQLILNFKKLVSINYLASNYSLQNVITIIVIARAWISYYSYVSIAKIYIYALWDEKGKEEKRFYIYKLSVVYNTRKLVTTKYKKCLLMIVIVIDHNVWSVFYLIHHLHERFPVVSNFITFVWRTVICNTKTWHTANSVCIIYWEVCKKMHFKHILQGRK